MGIRNTTAARGKSATHHGIPTCDDDDAFEVGVDDDRGARSVNDAALAVGRAADVLHAVSPHVPAATSAQAPAGGDGAGAGVR